jgi:hypothetical protein
MNTGTNECQLRGFVAGNRLMTGAWSDALDRLSLALPLAGPCHAGGMAISASSGK